MKDLSNLKHVTRPLKGGGFVMVLNTGAVITPDAEAMLQALHSRSVGGIVAHLKTLIEKGPERFMQTYYVGYGHKSIGDCGDITLFIEGVSMLVAQAIQDSRLYNGQEASTRYIDFSSQPFSQPLLNKNLAGAEILENWRHFYLRGLSEMVPVLEERFPRKTDEKEDVYKKAVKARAFDIMRGFLPAGTHTNLAWHGEMRHIADRLMLLRHHPLEEVRDVAQAIENVVCEFLPSSFSRKRYERTEEFNKWWMENLYLYTPKSFVPEFRLAHDGVDRELLAEYTEVLKRLPPKTDLPHQTEECGTLRFEFLLDFGSSRDLQRHRAVTQRMPLVTTRYGVGAWYLEELTSSLRGEAEALCAKQELEISKLGLSPADSQYFVAMGYNQPNRLSGGLAALAYLVQLRATSAVHPTLRQIARQMAESLRNNFCEYGLSLHLETNPDRFNTARGTHDIVPKP